MARRILTPTQYEAAFKQGKDSGLALGWKASNPHLSLESTDLFDRATATAWEMGWWSVCDKTPPKDSPEPDKASVRYWATVCYVLPVMIVRNAFHVMFGKKK
jgi:hypothetical protein